MAMPREKMPDRRCCTTLKAKLGGQTVYLSFGEFPDGRLGEIWVQVAKCGSFLRGSLDALARMASVALQSGTSPADVAKSLRHLNFEPRGDVEGSTTTQSASSLPDFIAQEIEAYYVKPQAVAPAAVSPPAEAPPALPSKVAGHIPSGSGV